MEVDSSNNSNDQNNNLSGSKSLSQQDLDNSNLVQDSSKDKLKQPTHNFLNIQLVEQKDNQLFYTKVLNKTCTIGQSKNPPSQQINNPSDNLSNSDPLQRASFSKDSKTTNPKLSKALKNKTQIINFADFKDDHTKDPETQDNISDQKNDSYQTSSCATNESVSCQSNELEDDLKKSINSNQKQDLHTTQKNIKVPEIVQKEEVEQKKEKPVDVQQSYKKRNLNLNLNVIEDDYNKALQSNQPQVQQRVAQQVQFDGQQQFIAVDQSQQPLELQQLSQNNLNQAQYSLTDQQLMMKQQQISSRQYSDMVNNLAEISMQQQMQQDQLGRKIKEDNLIFFEEFEAPYNHLLTTSAKNQRTPLERQSNNSRRSEFHTNGRHGGAISFFQVNGPGQISQQQQIQNQQPLSTSNSQHVYTHQQQMLQQSLSNKNLIQQPYELSNQINFYPMQFINHPNNSSIQNSQFSNRIYQIQPQHSCSSNLLQHPLTSSSYHQSQLQQQQQRIMPTVPSLQLESNPSQIQQQTLMNDQILMKDTKNGPQQVVQQQQVPSLVDQNQQAAMMSQDRLQMQQNQAHQYQILTQRENQVRHKHFILHDDEDLGRAAQRQEHLNAKNQIDRFDTDNLLLNSHVNMRNGPQLTNRTQSHELILKLHTSRHQRSNKNKIFAKPTNGGHNDIIFFNNPKQKDSNTKQEQEMQQNQQQECGQCKVHETQIQDMEHQIKELKQFLENVQCEAKNLKLLLNLKDDQIQLYEGKNHELKEQLDKKNEKLDQLMSKFEGLEEENLFLRAIQGQGEQNDFQIINTLQQNLVKADKETMTDQSSTAQLEPNKKESDQITKSTQTGKNLINSYKLSQKIDHLNYTQELVPSDLKEANIKSKYRDIENNNKELKSKIDQYKEVIKQRELDMQLAMEDFKACKRENADIHERIMQENQELYRQLDITKAQLIERKQKILDLFKIQDQQKEQIFKKSTKVKQIKKEREILRIEHLNLQQLFTEKCNQYRSDRAKLKEKVKKRDNKIIILEDKLQKYENYYKKQLQNDQQVNPNAINLKEDPLNMSQPNEPILSQQSKNIIPSMPTDIRSTKNTMIVPQQSSKLESTSVLNFNKKENLNKQGKVQYNVHGSGVSTSQPHNMGGQQQSMVNQANPNNNNISRKKFNDSCDFQQSSHFVPSSLRSRSLETTGNFNSTANYGANMKQFNQNNQMILMNIQPSQTSSTEMKDQSISEDQNTNKKKAGSQLVKDYLSSANNTTSNIQQQQQNTRYPSTNQPQTNSNGSQLQKVILQKAHTKYRENSTHQNTAHFLGRNNYQQHTNSSQQQQQHNSLSQNTHVSTTKSRQGAMDTSISNMILNSQFNPHIGGAATGLNKQYQMQGQQQVMQQKYSTPSQPQNQTMAHQQAIYTANSGTAAPTTANNLVIIDPYTGAQQMTNQNYPTQSTQQSVPQNTQNPQSQTTSPLQLTHSQIQYNPNKYLHPQPNPTMIQHGHNMSHTSSKTLQGINQQIMNQQQAANQAQQQVFRMRSNDTVSLMMHQQQNSSSQSQNTQNQHHQSQNYQRVNSIDAVNGSSSLHSSIVMNQLHQHHNVGQGASGFYENNLTTNLETQSNTSGLVIGGGKVYHQGSGQNYYAGGTGHSTQVMVGKKNVPSGQQQSAAGGANSGYYKKYLYM